MSSNNADFLKIVREKSVSLNDQEYLDTINYLVDEQPVLASLLFDLDDEISEEMQEYLYQVVVMLVNGFKETGIHVKLISEESVKNIIAEKDDLYKSAVDDENPQFDKEKMLALSHNPAVLELLYDNFFDRVTENPEDHNVYDRLNLLFMLDVLISAIEENTDLQQEI
ncbi:hypothetical protein JCM31826_08500 [Thermaurantimonas aggregans]|uniref:Uncharacterized protein n=1 Tax=Thermaurantimonas aggregans TaxID=2173829 RepID=A0A401XK31_9FLAO|nr:hypothetical protein [Thermaurantimonas aggregans]MCX8148558.1 hypothetical protein [Thermaurantimonas aggregans]GCD77368.1 hypothetical protein JCM31826_08500 [Thermaurantimonas aggregans]